MFITNLCQIFHITLYLYLILLEIPLAYTYNFEAQNSDNSFFEGEELFRCDSGNYILKNLFCDGAKKYLNSKKPPDCLDGSDENLDRCCAGNFDAYDE